MTPELSFIIYFHSSRKENLLQTLRFLKKRDREIIEKSELILVCNNSFRQQLKTSFLKTKIFSLEKAVYSKPFMCNFGAAVAESEKLVFLDSDRILPPDYFLQNIALLDVYSKYKGERHLAITTKHLFKLSKPYTDEEIEDNNIKKTPDFRTHENDLFKKNAFSGNIMMLKSDYFDAGGMDESFVGYGFADNDFTKTVVAKGIKIIFRKEEELHLCHSSPAQNTLKNIVGGGRKRRHSTNDAKRQWYLKSHVARVTRNENDRFTKSILNAIKYCDKWNVQPNQVLLQRIKEALRLDEELLKPNLNENLIKYLRV